MTIFADEAEAWKCPKHPSKRRSTGVCPVCLRERLVTLCPGCANVRPCSCCVTTSSSSSSPSSSSSFSRFPVFGDFSGSGAIGLVSELIESEPPFRRSCSVAVPFLRSQSKFINGEKDSDPYAHDSKEKKPATSFWSLFRKSKKAGVQVDDRSMAEIGGEYQQDTETPVMRKSRSMAAPEVSGSCADEWRPSGKAKAWYFPSPSKVFRQAKVSKIAQLRSPMHRG